jgi:hypothetical protein
LGPRKSSDAIHPDGKEQAMAKKGSGKNRSAKTGRYVKTDYAKTHPNTTVTEHDKKKPPPKKK